MSEKKKFLIATVVLGAMFFICAFGLSLLHESFLIVSLYCGIGALICGITLIELKEGKKLNLILLGAITAFIGIAFLCIGSFHEAVSIPFSLAYIVVGVLALIKGIRERKKHKKPESEEPKKRINAYAYVGIGMIIGGGALTGLLFQFGEWMMGFGYLIMIAGFVMLGIYDAIKKKETAEFLKRKNLNPSSEEKCHRCGRIKRPNELESLELPMGGKERYCSECRKVIEQEVKNHHTVCSVCGVDMPLEYMHKIDDALICHSCFVEKYCDVDSFLEEE